MFNWGMGVSQADSAVQCWALDKRASLWRALVFDIMTPPSLCVDSEGKCTRELGAVD
jgi:hypothetical protein